MSLENQWLENVFPIEIVPFWGHVSFGELPHPPSFYWIILLSTCGAERWSLPWKSVWPKAPAFWSWHRQVYQSPLLIRTQIASPKKDIRQKTSICYVMCYYTINTSMSALMNLVLLPSYTGNSQSGTGVGFAARASRPMKSFLSRAPRTPSRLIINEKLKWGLSGFPMFCSCHREWKTTKNIPFYERP